MAIDVRNGRSYHYICERRDGQPPRRRYLGAGAFGEWLAAIDADHRQAHRLRQRREQADREAVCAADQLTCRAVVAVRNIVTADMAKRGYRQHARGQWRKCHGGGKMRTSVRAQSVGAKAKREANALAGMAIEAWVQLLAGDDTHRANAIHRQLGAWRTELLRDGDSPLEVICVERVVLCRLEADVSDLRYVEQGQMSLRQGRFLVTRRQAAESRLSAALRTLACVRKLAQ